MQFVPDLFYYGTLLRHVYPESLKLKRFRVLPVGAGLKMKGLTVVAPAICNGVTPIQPEGALGQARTGGRLKTLVFTDI